MTRKVLLGCALLLVVVVGLYLCFRHPSAPLEVAYGGNKQTVVWSTSAQVRAAVGVISFGERVEVLQRFQEQVKIRTPKGLVGWVPEHDLLSADLWQLLQTCRLRLAATPAFSATFISRRAATLPGSGS